MNCDYEEIMEIAGPPPDRDEELCAWCAEHGMPCCAESDRTFECPWNARMEVIHKKAGMRKCACCGREFYISNHEDYRYKRVRLRWEKGPCIRYYCGYNCFQARDPAKLPPPLKGGTPCRTLCFRE